MNDSIKRRGAIDGLMSLEIEIRPSALQKIIDMLEKLPPVQTERKSGQWIHERVNVGFEYSVTGYFLLRSCKCSECGAICEQESNFCPNCGCRMEGDDKCS